MDPATNHPTEQQLREYGQGKLSLDSSRILHAHLKECRRCQRELDEINSEEFMFSKEKENDSKFVSATSTDENPKVAKLENVKPENVKPENVKLEAGKLKETVQARLATEPEPSLNLAHAPKEVLLGKPTSSQAKTKEVPGKDASTKTTSNPKAGAGSAPLKYEIPAELQNHSQYEVVRVLGVGGMGIVYLVRHRLTERKEVLKIIQPKWIDRLDVRKRFLREIQAAAKLDHPNVVKTLNALQEGNMLGLVMEYAPGESMTQVVKKNGPLPIEGAISLTTQAALGLAHAHNMGMVHRDIKPSNLQVTKIEKGLRVKILDFGLAKISSSKQSEEAVVEGGLYGTPLFMAPEQASNPDSADIRSDIYSLGCTLYFMLTGKPPFDGKTGVELVAQHAHQQPKPAYELRSEIPLGVIEVLDRMMAKNPEDRYRDPQTLVVALKDCLHQQEAFDDDAMTLEQFLGDDEDLRMPMDEEMLLPAIEATLPTKATVAAVTASPSDRLLLPPVRSKKKKVNNAKKPKASIMPLVLGSLLPFLVLVVVVIIKRPWELLSPEASMGRIILGEVEEGVEILVDNHTIPWKKDSLKSPAYIPSEPGDYDVAFRFQGVEIPFQFEGKKVTHAKISIAPREYKKLDVALSLPVKSPPKDLNATSEPKKAESIEPKLPSPTQVAQSDPVDKPEMMPSGEPKPDPSKPDPSKPMGDDPTVDQLAEDYIKKLATALRGKNIAIIREVLQAERPDLEAKDPNYEETESLIRIGKMVDRFQELRSTMLKELKAGDEIPVGESRVKVVENDGSKIVLFANSKSRTFLPDEISSTIIRGFVTDRLGSSDESRATGYVGVLFSEWKDESMATKAYADALKQLEGMQGSKEVSKPFFALLQKLAPSFEESSSKEDEGSPMQSVAMSKDSPYKFDRRLDGHTGPVVKTWYFADGKLGSFQRPEGSGAAINPNAQKSFASTWNLKNGIRESNVPAMTTGVRDFAISQNGKMITFYTGVDGSAEMELWMFGEKQATLTSQDFDKGDGRFFFSTDGKTLFGCDSGQRTIQWSIQAKGTRVKDSVSSRSPFPRDDVKSLNPSPDLSLLSVTSSKGNFYVWDTKSGERLEPTEEEIEALQAKLGPIQNCYFSKDNKKLLVCRLNGRSDLLQLPSLKLIKTVTEEGSKAIVSAQSPQNRLVSIAKEDKTVIIFDFDGEDILSFQDEGSASPISAVCTDAKGDSVAVGFNDSSIRIYRKR